ncbi:MAG: hypothetical protein HRU41_40925 [Saprospiraceae bacterium]|nr:hypothetical protein [Saprospiraceae bacterium]
MKFQITSIATALLVLFFSSTVFAQSSSSILAVADQTKQEEEKTFTTNVNEVLANVHQHISKKLEIDSDLFQYYNSTVSFTISFVIDQEGKIKKVHAIDNAKGPVVAKTIRQIKKMKKAPVVLENGKTVAKRFYLPIEIK